LSVRAKTLTIISLTLLGLILILYFTARAILLDSYTRLEEQDTRQNVERALNALADDTTTLARTAHDYSVWDDTYQFAADHNQTYLDNNFPEGTFTNNRLNLAALIDERGALLFAQGFDLAAGQFAPAPKLFLALAPGDALLQHVAGDSDNGAQGVVLLPEGPMLVASRPILLSDDSGPTRGSLLMGRHLDEAEITRLAESTRLTLSVWRLDGTLAGELQAARAALSDAAPVAVKPLDGQTVVGYALIKDVYARPALILRVELPRNIYRQGQDSLTYFVGALFVAGLVIGVVLGILLESIVLHRLARLSTEVSHIGVSHDFAERVTSQGRDELGHLSASINGMLTALEQLNRQLEIEQGKSQDLLLNVLPETIVKRLKEGEEHIADRYLEGTVLFADLVDFTEISSRISPDDVVTLLNDVFSAFDELADKLRLEKIKTIGDAYMVVGGLPVPRADHAEAVAEMALEMLKALDSLESARALHLRVRIGINSGPVVAGVVGTRKFLYDLWGDTVNTASRMESHGLAGGIQVTAATYEKLRDKYEFKERGMVLVKGKGEMVTYLLIGRKDGHAG
jgi:sensor domain CHASE-containing protein/class 3 adenylate cyclase